MKQTAVQWLAFNLGEHIVWEEKIIDLVEKALDMEKEQIIDAYDNTNSMSMNGEQYYKETYETQND